MDLGPLLIIVLLGLTIILLIIYLTREYPLWQEASKDYAASRGTAHKKSLLKARDIVKNRLNTLGGSIKEEENKAKQLSVERGRRIEAAAATLIVRNEFKVPGIGDKLKERILAQCFNGSLSSLYNASRVHGIGPQKADAIRQWIRWAEQRQRLLIQAGFPGKKEIEKEYERRESESSERLVSLRSDAFQSKKLLSQIDEGLHSLLNISSSTFRKALKGDEEAASKVARYILGVYPDWEEEPLWFSEAMEQVKAS